LIASSDLSLRELDDLAVLVLFSVFESLVRSRISDEVQKEVEEKVIVYVILVKATNDAIERIEADYWCQFFFNGIMAIRQARREPLALSASGHERMVNVVIVRLSLRSCSKISFPY